MRLIDADALMKHIKDVPTWQDCDEYLWKATNYPHGMYDPEDIVSSIENTPTIDAVEVVRCRDCTHITPVEGGVPLCTMHDRACGDYDFCSYGERRSE